MKDHNLMYTGYNSIQEFQKGLEDFINEDKNKWKLYASSSRYQEKSLWFSGSEFRVTSDVSGSSNNVIYQGNNIELACKTYLEL